jgi:hypothetical protein
MLVVLAAATAWAAATFDPDPLMGPEWLPPYYQWEVEVLTISNPDKIVCLEYYVNGAGPTKQSCDCDDSGGGDCVVGTGDWTCKLLGPIADATIDWRIGTWSAGSGGDACGEEKTLAGANTFNTGPNAVTLASFGAASTVTGLVVAALAGLLAVVIVAVWLVRHRLA